MIELRIKDICTKGSSSLKQKDVEKLSGDYPVYGASGQIATMQSYHREENYIAIVKDGSGIGRVMFLPAKSSVIGTMQYILPKSGYDINYIGYCLQSLDLSSYKQGAAIPHIYFRDYGERLVKVEESLSAQKEIVAKIDAEFAKIDQIKSNAKSALDEADSLLKSEIDNCLQSASGWSSNQLGNLCVIKGEYGLAAPAVEYNGVRYLRITDITDWGDLNNELVSADIDGICKQKPLEDGDILFARTGATVGKTLVYRSSYGNCLFAGYLIRYRPDKSRIAPRYLFYMTHSEKYLEWVKNNQKAAAQPNINAKLYNSYVIDYPPVKEQQEIVDHLDLLFGKVKRLRRNYELVSNECEAMKKAILKEIFN